jgi:Dihydrouridine synthase (Dus)
MCVFLPLSLSLTRTHALSRSLYNVCLFSPKPFSVSGGMGSALLSDPDRACRIIKTLSHNLPANMPVSAKIRLLPGDASHTVDFITALINAGANAVAIHGRRVGDESQTPADWKMLETVVAMTKSKFPRVPILINGDFYTRREFTDFMQKSGANGVLLARPALYNTSIFRKPPSTPILQHAAAAESEPASASAIQKCYSYDSNLLLDKTTVIQDYLRHVCKYNMHHKNCKYVICEMMNNRRAPLSRVPFLKQVYPGRQTIGLMSSCTSVADICRLWNVNVDSNDISINRSNNNNNNLSTIPTALHEDWEIPTSATAAARHNSPAPIVAIPTAGEHRYDDSYLLKMAEDPTIEEGTTATSSVAACLSAAVMTTAALATAITASPSSSNDTNVLDSPLPPPPAAKKIRVDGGEKS